jgi:TM2 domain-containing membrane protein YozV
MFCRTCGKEIAEHAVICLSCGCVPASGKKFCQNCGAETNPAAAVCVKCGVRLAATGEKSRLVAGLLGVFLGCLGVHRFYLGYVGIGIVQIIVTLVTCGPGGLWGFIEGIIILAGGWDRDAKGLPLKD